MTVEHWDTNPRAWNTLKIGAFTMPGVWDVDTSVKRIIDIKKAAGQVGANYKDKGDDVSMVDFVGKMATADHLAELKRILPSIHQRDALGKKGQPRKVFKVEHPKLALLGIQNVYVKEVFSPTHEKGIMTLKIRVVEHVPKPKAVKTSKQPRESLEEALAPAAPKPPATSKDPR